MSEGIGAYPWDRVERVERSVVGAARRVRSVAPERVRADSVGRALGELLTSEVVLRVRKIGPAAFAGAPRGVMLASSDGALRIVVEPDAALLTTALSRLLERSVLLTDPSGGLDPSLRGALAAICVEAARRSSPPLALRATAKAPPRDDGLRLDVTVRLDAAPYDATIWLFADARPTSGESKPELGLLGDLPITVPVVAAVSEAARASDVTALRVGDVWLPGDGWLHRGAVPASTEPQELHEIILRRAALASPGCERGVETGRSDDGRIVIRGNVVALVAAPGEQSAGRAERVAGTGSGRRDRAMSDPDETLREIALEAPVVVRVEVASVTLTAREWAKLGPGDVIETGVRLETPVVLRVGGREVARGELVSVDGELGVRIAEIVDPGRSP